MHRRRHHVALDRWLGAPAEASPLEVGRVAGRIEQLLTDFATTYRELLRAPDGPGAAEEHRLLIGVYRHFLNDIRGWLDRLVAVIADPRAELERQGLPLVEGGTLTVNLTLTDPPELAQLERTRAAEATTPEPPELCTPPRRRRESPEPGLLAHLGAIAFGFGVADAWSKRNRKE